MIKIQSYFEYKIGTILLDNDTRELFEVIGCERIRLLSTQANFGLKLKRIKI